MLRHLVDVEEVKAAAQQSVADRSGPLFIETFTRGGSGPLCNRPQCIRNTSNGFQKDSRACVTLVSQRRLTN